MSISIIDIYRKAETIVLSELREELRRSEEELDAVPLDELDELEFFGYFPMVRD